ncbi:MAG: replication initiator protein A [Alphaproteobacteria bacterium]|nr:replication initiator protein A [Alphaproteobacteria bacterium]MCK5556384.1 replication initiator protein A [Alphaproteobacteria bacterium]
MVKISKESKSPLLPVRYPTPDFFVCDLFDAVPKGDMAAMEHPIFSLSTKPDTRIRRYEHNGRFVEITPSVKGLATMHDRDVLIYCISQLMAGLNDKREVSQIVRFKAYDLLQATNRITNGQGYEGLKAAFERLRGTTISTNITTGGEEQFDIFGLIDRAKIVRQTRDGRMQEIEIKLSDWVYNAIKAKEVLTLHRDYFRLRKPLERRMYELARKHCGAKSKWCISLDLLQKKCGSNSTSREFKRLVMNIIRQDEKHQHMPDYSLHLDGKQVVFRNRGTMHKKEESGQKTLALLSPDAYEKARRAAPSWDIHYLEQEWRNWIKEAPKHPDKAFVGFCCKWFETRGRA